MLSNKSVGAAAKACGSVLVIAERSFCFFSFFFFVVCNWLVCEAANPQRGCSVLISELTRTRSFDVAVFVERSAGFGRRSTRIFWDRNEPKEDFLQPGAAQVWRFRYGSLQQSCSSGGVGGFASDLQHRSSAQRLPPAAIMGWRGGNCVFPFISLLIVIPSGFCFIFCRRGNSL